ncbi:MAG: SLC13 family permease, partial [Bacteroidota bacterium]
NLVLAGIVQETYGIEISFTQWLIFGLPISVILLFLCWRYLTHFAFSFKQKSFPGGRAEIQQQLKALGPIKPEERAVLVVFVFTGLAWISRSFILQAFIPNLDDTIIAVIASVALFLIPSTSQKGRALITWEEAVKLPWGILLLFGGGLALAQGFKISGLAEWIGGQMNLLEGVSLLILLLILVAAVNFLTEITSNLATTAMLLPILAPLALGIEVHPYILLVGATVAASCAFMLPVATPPNAVVFGSGYLKIVEMVRVGIWMNIISILVLSAITYFLLPYLWGFDPLVYPLEWIK